MGKEVVVIGGGVIGYCSAYYLSEGGHRVIVIDRKDEHSGCSYKNAGMVVPSHFIPLAAPGVIKTALKWMLRRDSPFYIRPRIDSDLFRWSWLFNSHANKSHVLESAPILAKLNNSSRDLYQILKSDLKGEFHHKSNGLLMLYNTKKSEQEELENSSLAEELGIKTEVLSNGQLNKLDNGVEYDVRGAVYYPGDAFLDPAAFMNSMERRLMSNGVEIRNGSGVSKIEYDNNRITGVFTDNSKIEAEEFVMAAGIYSSALARNIGIDIPMQGGKGYSVTLSDPKSLPQICSILTEARVAVTPMGKKLRLAGTMEIAGLDHSINSRRVNGYLKAIENYIPEFGFDNIETGSIWAGLRPVSPDGMPYLGRTSRFPNLIIATGHAMMGMSMGPITGEIVADLVEGKEVLYDLNQLSPDRFRG